MVCCREPGATSLFLERDYNVIFVSGLQNISGLEWLNSPECTYCGSTKYNYKCEVCGNTPLNNNLIKGRVRVMFEILLPTGKALFNIFNDDIMHINFVSCGRMDVFDNYDYRVTLSNFDVAHKKISYLSSYYPDRITFHITVDCNVLMNLEKEN